MKHRSLKITALLLSLVFVFLSFSNAFSFEASASNADVDTPIVDKKVISTTTIEDDFADNAILVVLSKKETQKFKSYTREDFDGLEIANVEDSRSCIKYMENICVCIYTIY